MDLKTYTSLNRGRAAELARLIGVSPVLISQWAAGERDVPMDHCVPIEKATNRIVTCEELRPDKSEYWAYLRSTDQVEQKEGA